MGDLNAENSTFKPPGVSMSTLKIMCCAISFLCVVDEVPMRKHVFTHVCGAGKMTCNRMARELEMCTAEVFVKTVSQEDS